MFATRNACSDEKIDLHTKTDHLVVKAKQANDYLSEHRVQDLIHMLTSLLVYKRPSKNIIKILFL